MTSSKWRYSIGKRQNSNLLLGSRNPRPFELFIGNVNGFRVTKILEIQGKKNLWKAELTLQLSSTESGRRSAPNRCRASGDSKLRMIRVANQCSRKRKTPSADKVPPQDESCDFERELAPKKIKMDLNLRSSLHAVEKCLPDSPIPIQKVAADKQIETAEEAVEQGYEADAEVGEVPMPPEESPVVSELYQTFSPSQHQESDSLYTALCLRSSWRDDFLRKCAELVEVRFRTPVRVTCVKPFYGRFKSCFQDTDAARRLESSTLPKHQDIPVSLADTEDGREVFSSHENNLLIRNFFQISRAYSLRHPYLLACIQTGLETRKEVHDFNKFRMAYHIIEKLCVDIPEKSSVACVLQLRSLLTPQVLPFAHFETEKVVANLFAGFGPDWNTIGKLTGFSQFTLKTMLALIHEIDSGAITPQIWFDIHQRILETMDSRMDDPKRRRRPPRRFSPVCKVRPTRGASQSQPSGKLDGRKSLKLPSFSDLFSSQNR